VPQVECQLPRLDKLLILVVLRRRCQNFRRELKGFSCVYLQGSAPSTEGVRSFLGVDQGQSFFGMPSLTVPFLGVTTPEIALFKSAAHQGYAEIQIYTLDGASGDLLTRSSRAVGESAYNQYTILVILNFSRTDLDDPEDAVH
jgi:hypothetical protein